MSTQSCPISSPTLICRSPSPSLAGFDSPNNNSRITKDDDNNNTINNNNNNNPLINTDDIYPEILIASAWWTEALRNGAIGLNYLPLIRCPDKYLLFYRSLSSLLYYRYSSHWYPSDPSRGSGYRSISYDNRFDRLLKSAGEKIDLKEKESMMIFAHCRFIIMKINPGSVKIVKGGEGGTADGAENNYKFIPPILLYSCNIKDNNNNNNNPNKKLYLSFPSEFLPSSLSCPPSDIDDDALPPTHYNKTLANHHVKHQLELKEREKEEILINDDYNNQEHIYCYNHYNASYHHHHHPYCLSDYLSFNNNVYNNYNNYNNYGNINDDFFPYDEHDDYHHNNSHHHIPPPHNNHHHNNSMNNTMTMNNHYSPHPLSSPHNNHQLNNNNNNQIKNTNSTNTTTTNNNNNDQIKNNNINNTVITSVTEKLRHRVANITKKFMRQPFINQSSNNNNNNNNSSIITINTNPVPTLSSSLFNYYSDINYNSDSSSDTDSPTSTSSSSPSPSLSPLSLFHHSSKSPPAMELSSDNNDDDYDFNNNNSTNNNYQYPSKRYLFPIQEEKSDNNYNNNIKELFSNNNNNNNNNSTTNNTNNINNNNNNNSSSTTNNTNNINNNNNNNVWGGSLFSLPSNYSKTFFPPSLFNQSIDAITECEYPEY